MPATEWRCERFAELDHLIALEDARDFRALDRHAISRGTEGVSVPEASTDTPQVKSALKWERHKDTIDEVLEVVADHFDTRPERLLRKCNRPEVAYPRMIAMYLVRHLTGASPRDIGMVFAGKHHTSVRYSIREIERRMERDEDVRDLVVGLECVVRIRKYVSGSLR